MLLGVAYIVFYENDRYVRVANKHGGRAPPEARLPGAMLGAPCLVIGLAWFAATDSPSVHWIVPILAGVPFACKSCLARQVDLPWTAVSSTDIAPSCSLAQSA